jgi:hypothetical protein
MAERILSARASRTFYNVADAIVPSASGAGAGDVDLVPWVERSLRGRGVGAARRTWLVLTALEWWPIVTLKARHGFSRASLERRREVLESWSRSRLGVRREAMRGLEVLVRKSFESQVRSEVQPAELKDQSEGGA